MPYRIPILLITFNRPNHIKKTLMEVRKVFPTDLYIAQDGPRDNRPDDIPKVQAVREVIKEIVDWPCRLHTHYSEKNLGCGPGPYEAISWFFENVEYGVILEDDIIPHPLFFPFMETMLLKYATNEKIGIVAGHNYFRKYSLFNSYYFTFDTEGTLGWGTWRRVWKNIQFDVKVNDDDFVRALRHYYNIPSIYARQQVSHFHNVLDRDRHDRWDYQLEYSLKLYGYLNIKPNSCLTSHVGDEGDATHSGYYTSPNYKMEVHERVMYPIKHPSIVRVDLIEKLRMWKKTVLLKFKYK